MKKLRLELDTLTVASFTTAEAEGDRGTVQGNFIPTNPQCAGTQRTYCPNTLCTCPPPP